MSREHFGAAVVVAGVLTASPIALGEVEEGNHARTEISGYGGWDHFRAPAGVLVVDSNGVADDNGAGARNTRSSPENDPMYAIIPPTTRSSVISDSPAVDPFQTTFGTGNSNNIGTFARAPAHPLASTPTGSSAALRSVSYAKSTLPPGGCARCGGQVARASAGRAKSFAALFSRNFFRKGGAVLSRHLVSGIGRQRNPALLAASTVQRSWLNPSL
jgi:hypothetical protein